MFRLPASAVFVKVSGEPDKIFVPIDREAIPVTAHPAMDSISETVAVVVEGVEQGTAFSDVTSKRDISRGDKASPDWGSKRQVFARVDKDIIAEDVLKSTDANNVVLTTPMVDARPPPKLSPERHTVDRTDSDSSKAFETELTSQHHVVSEMKCKTLMFCPLCADVVLPQQFGAHFSKCPEISTLTSNGEYNIVVNALSEGLSSFTNSISEFVKSSVAKVPRTDGHSGKFNTRPDTSPMPSRVLDFGPYGDHTETEVSVTQNFGESTTISNNRLVKTLDAVKGQEKRGASGSDGTAGSSAQSKCAFCGKISTKSALSAHLLVCKSRKQMQMKRQSALQNNAANGMSTGKSKPAVLHHRTGTPNKGARKGVTSAPSRSVARPTTQKALGSSTPSHTESNLELENNTQFISPDGVVDVVNSAGRNGTKGVNRSTSKSGVHSRLNDPSPLKGGTRDPKSKPLSDRSNLNTPTRTIATRVFM